MKILITGGTGLLGRYVTERLVAEGHDVAIASRSVSAALATARNPRHHVADFADYVAMKELCAGKDAVMHLAWTTVPKGASDNPSYDVQSNVVGTISLLRACMDGNVRLFVFASTGGAVYGEGLRLPIHEAHPTDPISSYGITKLTVEKYIQFFHHTGGLEFRTLRIANAYGVGPVALRGQGVISTWLRQVKQGESLECFGGDETIRDYVHARDVADAFARVLSYEGAARTINVGTGRSHSNLEVLEIVRRVTGFAGPVRRLGGRSFDVQRNVLDGTLAFRELGWLPKTELQDGVAELWRALDA